MRSLSPPAKAVYVYTHIHTRILTRVHTYTGSSSREARALCRRSRILLQERDGTMLTPIYTFAQSLTQGCIFTHYTLGAKMRLLRERFTHVFFIFPLSLFICFYPLSIPFRLLRVGYL